MTDEAENSVVQLATFEELVQKRDGIYARFPKLKLWRPNCCNSLWCHGNRDDFSNEEWEAALELQTVQWLLGKTTMPEVKAVEAAWYRFPEPTDVDTGEPVDDWGYEAYARQAFIDGWRAARPIILDEVSDMTCSTQWMNDKAVEAAAEAIAAAYEDDPDECVIATRAHHVAELALNAAREACCRAASDG